MKIDPKRLHPDNLLRPIEAARLLDIEPRTLANWRLDGKICYIKYNKRNFRYLKDSVLAFKSQAFQEPLFFDE